MWALYSKEDRWLVMWARTEGKIMIIDYREV